MSVTVSQKEQKNGGGAATGISSTAPPTSSGVWRALTSVRLTLWLIAILTIAMAVATLIPQNAPTEAYMKAFGTVFGPLVAKTTLRNIYGSWWFIGGFALLAVNLLMCSLQRAGQLLARDRELPARLTRTDVETRGRRERWRLTSDTEIAAQAVADGLRGLGYAVAEVPGEETGQRGLLARRGHAQGWAPVLVHVGMIIVLIGAAWGRWPSNVHHAAVDVSAGETAPIKVGDEAFGLRLLDAGTKYGPTGQPSEYWAKAQIVEEGTVVRDVTIRPNYPLRYHQVSFTLNSLSSAGYGLAVKEPGKEEVFVPVTVGPDGTVDIGHSYLELDPKTGLMVVVSAVRDHDEQGRPGAAAFVKVGHMGTGGHSFQNAGWVTASGLDAAGLHLRLVQAGTMATLNMDRDIGVPIVFFGFLLATMGTLLVLSSPRRSVAALVSARGRGAQVLVGISAAGNGREGERVVHRLEAELGAAPEAGPQQKSEE